MGIITTTSIKNGGYIVKEVVNRWFLQELCKKLQQFGNILVFKYGFGVHKH